MKKMGYILYFSMDLEYYIPDYSFSKYCQQITFILRLINEAKNHNPLLVKIVNQFQQNNKQKTISKIS